MPIKLPPCFIRDEVADIKEEAAPYRTMKPARRAQIMAACCYAGFAILKTRRDRRKVLQWRDPLPASTVDAFRRLSQT